MFLYVLVSFLLISCAPNCRVKGVDENNKLDFLYRLQGEPRAREGSINFQRFGQFQNSSDYYTCATWSTEFQLLSGECNTEESCPGGMPQRCFLGVAVVTLKGLPVKKGNSSIQPFLTSSLCALSLETETLLLNLPALVCCTLWLSTH